MSRLRLSNLHVRPNLLSAGHYQQEMLGCSVFELRDIKERNPNLISAMPPSKQEEWRESLFWGRPPPPTDPAWAEYLAGGLSDEVRDLEERPTLEAALECLILARQLYHTRPDGPARAAAAEWDRKVCVVLARDEFRLTPDMIDQRLESILGRQLTGPTLPDVPPLEPRLWPTVAAESSPRQPLLFPTVVDAKTTSAPEPLAADDRGMVPPSVPSDAMSEPAPVLPVVTTTPVTGESAPPAGLTPLAAESPRPLLRAEPEQPRTAPATATPDNPPDSPPAPAGLPRTTTTLTVRDPDLKRLVQRWATLPDHVRKCVVMLLDAAEATRTPTH